MADKSLKRRLNDLGGGLAATIRPFYRRFPYKGPIAFFKVDPRGAYSPDEPFFYNRVPKAANTTIVHTLRQHSTYQRPFAQKGNPKDHFLRPMYMSTADVDRMVNDAFKFTVVRDPYSRVLSAFQSKILGGRPQAELFRAWAGSDDTPSFAQFCRYLADGNQYADMHWAPQADMLLLPIEMFDFVGKVETLDADLAHITARIFGEEASKGMVQAGKVTGATDKVAQAYGPEQFEIISDIYAADFDTFDYPHRKA